MDEKTFEYIVPKFRPFSYGLCYRLQQMALVYCKQKLLIKIECMLSHTHCNIHGQNVLNIFFWRPQNRFPTTVMINFIVNKLNSETFLWKWHHISLPYIRNIMYTVHTSYFVMVWYRGGSYLANFLRSVIFLISHLYQKTRFLLNFKFILYKRRHNIAAVTPVKHGCDSKSLIWTFARSKIVLTEKLTKEL